MTLRARIVRCFWHNTIAVLLIVLVGTIGVATRDDSHADRPDVPDSPAAVMAERDIGSLIVMSHERVVGILTFREVIQAAVNNGGSFEGLSVYRSMNPGPLICTPETELDEVRRMMLGHHARYMPVMDKRMLMGVVSFYDVAKAVVDSQNFENKLLKAYIRDWPQEESPPAN